MGEGLTFLLTYYYTKVNSNHKGKEDFVYLSSNQQLGI